MTMPLIFRAMTKQREGLLLRQVLKQTQGEFLSVVFDSLVPRIDSAAFHKLLEVQPAVLTPGYLAGEDSIAQLFARPEVRHPDIESVRRQPAASSSRGKNPEAVAGLDSALN